MSRVQCHLLPYSIIENWFILLRAREIKLNVWDVLQVHCTQNFTNVATPTTLKKTLRRDELIATLVTIKTDAFGLVV
jgi:hypothetical protein